MPGSPAAFDFPENFLRYDGLGLGLGLELAGMRFAGLTNAVPPFAMTNLAFIHTSARWSSAVHHDGMVIVILSRVSWKS